MIMIIMTILVNIDIAIIKQLLTDTENIMMDSLNLNNIKINKSKLVWAKLNMPQLGRECV